MHHNYDSAFTSNWICFYCWFVNKPDRLTLHRCFLPWWTVIVMSVCLWVSAVAFVSKFFCRTDKNKSQSYKKKKGLSLNNKWINIQHPIQVSTLGSNIRSCILADAPLSLSVSAVSCVSQITPRGSILSPNRLKPGRNVSINIILWFR